MIGTEQEGIYREKSITLLKGIHVKLIYTVDNALGIFEKCPLWVP